MTKLLILLLLTMPASAKIKNIDKILIKIEKESGCKLRVTSGYRTKKQNRRVGGAPKSFHLLDRARDFHSAKRKKGCGIKRLAKIACKYATTIRYKFHVHVDDRKDKKCFRGKYKR